VLRCYADSPDAAKNIWKNALLPLAKQTLFAGRSGTAAGAGAAGVGAAAAAGAGAGGAEGSDVAFQEVCEKSLEALMFVR
jgi:hypothetical protein